MKRITRRSIFRRLHITTPPSASGALTGLRVLDISRVLAGPYCAQLLSDHGAEVIKVEPPAGDETRSLGPPFIGDSAAYFSALNRNKRALALDLAQPAGREVLLRLLEDADVLIENFLPGTMEKWGLGFGEVLSRRFPRLVYCRITGFGASGPLGSLPGYDAVLQAMGGLMSINGAPEIGPTRVGTPLVDVVTGIYCAFGVMLALAAREKTGRGQMVDGCLYDTSLSLLIPHAANFFASGKVPGLTGSAHPNIAPYDKFATADGEIFLGVVNDGQFRKLCAVLDQPGWAEDPRYAGNAARLRNKEALKADLEEVLRGHEPAALCKTLMAAGVPAGPVHTVAQALDHAHTAHREMAVEAGGMRMLGVPVKLSATPGAARTAPPRFAEHTDEVLAQAGYGDEEIAKLIAEGAVRIERAGARKP
ncbi:MAG: bbsF 7 [Betaproteobacteria bacterium]|nr:bbsF 7 [Betaproteobacteria bacterium]